MAKKISLKRTTQVELYTPKHADLLHELMHGAYLTHCHLQEVGGGGDMDFSIYQDIFKKCPSLKKKYLKALKSVWDFYQECGEASADLEYKYVP
jgi:hypothetical protein